jgi:glutaminase
MDTKEAILAFSQSEKIKAGIIWISQSLELLARLPEKNRKSAERLAHVFLNLMLRDVHIARRVTAESEWREVEKNIDLALVMLDSGVAQESTYHLTRALSSVTDIGQRSMSFLRDKGLL